MFLFLFILSLCHFPEAFWFEEFGLIFWLVYNKTWVEELLWNLNIVCALEYYWVLSNFSIYLCAYEAHMNPCYSNLLRPPSIWNPLEQNVRPRIHRMSRLWSNAPHGGEGGWGRGQQWWWGRGLRRREGKVKEWGIFFFHFWSLLTRHTAGGTHGPCMASNMPRHHR